MSVTTTSNPLTYTVQSVLTDYELHHSEHSDQPAPAPNDTPVPRTSNPPNWPENYRRIPEHRPTNRELDQAERRVYQNPIERAFISTMFTGLYTNVVCCPSACLMWIAQYSPSAACWENVESHRWEDKWQDLSLQDRWWMVADSRWDIDAIVEVLTDDWNSGWVWGSSSGDITRLITCTIMGFTCLCFWGFPSIFFLHSIISSRYFLTSSFR